MVTVHFGMPLERHRHTMLGVLTLGVLTLGVLTLGVLTSVLAACGSSGPEGPGIAGGSDASNATEPDASNSGAPDASDDGARDASVVDSGSDAGVPLLPEVCTTSPECGANAECANSVCVCAASYRPCGGGCCKAALSTTSIPTLWGERASVAIASDGTVYAAVRHDHDVADVGELWVRPSGGSFARSRTFADGDGIGAVCLTLRDDIAYLALAHDGNVTMQRADGSGDVTVIGGTGLNRQGLGCLTAPDGTIWIAWVRPRPQATDALEGVAIPLAGARRDFRYGLATTSTTEVDLALDPTTQRPWAFVVARSGTVLGTSFDLVDGTDGGHRPSDHATIGPGGRIHSLAYTSFDSALFSASIGGVLAEFNAPASLPASRASSFRNSDVTLGPGDIPYIAGFDDSSRRVVWYAGIRADSWSGADYGHFPLVAPQTHHVYTTAARAHDGAAAFLSFASRADLGAAIYSEIR